MGGNITFRCSLTHLYTVGRDTPAARAATDTDSAASNPSQNAKRTLKGDHGLPIDSTP